MLPVRNAAYAATFVSEGSVGEMSSDFKAEGYEGLVCRTRIAKRVAVVRSVDAIGCAARVTLARQHHLSAHVLKWPWEVRSGAGVVRESKAAQAATLEGCGKQG
jgi:hypothetical protein